MSQLHCFKDDNLHRVVVEDISNNNELVKIPIINNFNDEKPKIFIYSVCNRFTDYVNKLLLPMNTPKFCNCKEGNACLPGVCTCEDASSVIFDPKLRIVCQPIGPTSYNDYHYVECGPHCGCKGKCGRQMSRDQLMKKVEVHYKDRMGFGVVATQHIAIGMPICNYVGTITTRNYLEEYRFSLAAKTDYIFNICNDRKNTILLSDAAYYGNVSRFINHSCDPNTHIMKSYPYIYGPDSNKISLPKIVVVACQNIQPGDEITICYGASYFHSRNIPCLCYSFCCFVPPFDYEEKSQSKKEAYAIRASRRKAVGNNWADTADISVPLINVI